MLKRLKPILERGLQTLFRRLPRINPNFITISGLIPPALFLYFLINGRYGWAMVCYLGTPFDTLDGAYARATGQVTKFGALLDSTLDRIADALIIAAFGFAGLVDWWLCLGLIIASFTISYVRARGEAQTPLGRQLAAGPIERPERLAIILLAFIIYSVTQDLAFHTFVLPTAFAILLGLSVVTVFRRLHAAHKVLEK